MSRNPYTIYITLDNYIQEYKQKIDDCEVYINYKNLADYRKKFILNLISSFRLFYLSKYTYFKAYIYPIIIEYRSIVNETLIVYGDNYSDKSLQTIDKKNTLSDTINTEIDQFIRENSNILNYLYTDIEISIDENVCLECKIENSYNSEFQCIYCGFINDNKRPSVSIYSKCDIIKKTKYVTNEMRFKEMETKLNELQSKYNPIIPNIVYNNINEYINNNKINSCDIDILLIRNILSYTKNELYYKYDRFILNNIKQEIQYKFTKDEETEILKCFKMINNAIDTLKLRMPDFNYIIFNVLKRLNISCKSEHFDLAKTIDKQTRQEYIMRDIMRHLGWKYYPFF